MPSQALIDARLLIDGKPLQEYRDFNGLIDSPGKLTRYVEVKAGQKFSIKVTLLKGFNFCFAPGVYIGYEIDQGEGKFYREVDVPEQRKITEFAFKEVSSKFSTEKRFDESVGLWRKYDLVFGVFGISDEATVPDHLRDCDVDSLGSIRVTVFRYRKKYCKYKPFKIPARSVDELPESMMKGKALKNTVKFENGDDCEAPPDWDYDPVPIVGDNGQKYEFVFLYRTKREYCHSPILPESQLTDTEILQSIGCIPRSPSPSPSAVLAAKQASNGPRIPREERRGHSLRLIKQEETRAQAGAGAQATVKNEDEDEDECWEHVVDEDDRTTPTTTTTTSSSASFIWIPGKRVREEDEDEPLEVVPPPRKRLQIIDLTEDE